MKIGDVLADQINGTRDWTLRLIAELRGDDWSFQPGPGLAHARYLIGHMAVSQNVLIHVRCLGMSILDDSFAAHFPIGSPIRAVSEYSFPPVEELLGVMTSVHERSLAAVRGMGEELLAEPAWGKDGAVHPHYRDKLGAVSHCERHEAFHAGQIATIRRLLRKAFLR